MGTRNQMGIGMMEVLVSLFILAIGVLGFSALQLRAVDATMEANDKTVAMNLAKDLTERMRINRLAANDYIDAINDKTTNDTCFAEDADESYVPICTGEDLAQYDAKEILEIAESQSQTIVLDECDGSFRTCVYVAWGHTEISKGDVSQCSRDGSYVPNAKCIIMEAF